MGADRITLSPDGRSALAPDADGNGPGSHPADQVEALRLVRLRLALGMLAMAVVPIVLLVLVGPALSGADRAAEAHAAASSGAVAAAVSADLGRIRGALILTASDPQVAAFLVTKTGPSTAVKSRLAATSALLGAAVPAVDLIDAAGAVRLRLRAGQVVTIAAAAAQDPTAGAVTALPAGQVQRSQVPPTSTANGTFGLAAPVRAAAAGTAAGVVRFSVSADQLLAAAAASTGADPRHLFILDASSGTPIGHGGGPDVPAALPALRAAAAGVGGPSAAAGPAGPGAPVSVSGDGWVVGSAPISAAVPGFADWAVVSAQPSGGSGLPLPLALILLGLVAAIAGLAAWMARQVVRPAADLDASHQELAALYEVARRDALVDPLTGLGNHRAFQERLGRELDQARRLRYPVALMLLDLDDFKQVNDRAGHASGDAVLSAFGLLLTGGIRRGDEAFRIGGDEFAVVMPRTDADGGLIVARRALATALEPAGGGASRRAPISFSAGIAAAPDQGTVAGELAARADAALYWGKRHGRTSVEIYDPERHRAELPGLVDDAGSAVAAVIERRLLRPAFQPIVRLSDGAILGFEGLVRPLPESGFSDAADLFAAAAAAGRTMDLDRQCVETVAAAAGRLGEDQFLGLNISPLSLEAADFSAGAIRASLARFGLTPERVILEVTEREPVQALDRLRASLEACRAAGFRVAVDDVGAGNAGLRLLSTVRFDMVKIDLGLVREGARHDPASSVLRSLVELARGWGALVVAEGIEDEAELRAMQALKVEAGQGYLLGRPGDTVSGVPPVDLEALHDDGAWRPAGVFRPWQLAPAGASVGSPMRRARPRG